MGARDLIVTAVLLSSLPFCLFKPWVGILIYSVIGYLNPHRLTWSTTDLPFAFWASIPTFAGLLFTRDRRPFPLAREVVLLVLFWCVTLLSSVLAAVYPVEAWDQFIKFTKILIAPLLTLMLFQDVRKLRWLLWIIAGSIGFYGVKGGLWAVATGGSNQVLGPQGSFIAGNTEIGLALNMVLPMLFVLRQEVARPWPRRLLLGAFLLTIIAILVTYSRGALLGLAAVLLLLAFQSGRRALAIGTLVIVLPIAAVVLPSKWSERMETMQNYEEDPSAMGRIWAWKLSWRVAQDRPLLGAGFQCFGTKVYLQYMPEAPQSETDAHNIFFQVLAEHGFTGLILFVALILSTLASLRDARRLTKRAPEVRVLHSWAGMIQVSLIAFVFNGFFLSRSYFDLFYHLVAIAILIRLLAQRWAGGLPVPGLEPAPSAPPAPALPVPAG